MSLRSKIEPAAIIIERDITKCLTWHGFFRICFWGSLVSYSVFIKRNISSSIKYLLTEKHKKDANIHNVWDLKMFKKRVFKKESTKETPFIIDITFCTRRLWGFLIFIKVLRNMKIMWRNLIYRFEHRSISYLT